MNRYVLILRDKAERRTAHLLIDRAVDYSRIEIKGPQRTIEQNKALWLWLTAWWKAKPDGRDLTPGQWKAVLMHAWGREVQFLPALEGSGFVPWGHSSSDLSVSEMSDLLEFVIAEATKRGIAPPPLEGGTTDDQPPPHPDRAASSSVIL